MATLLEEDSVSEERNPEEAERDPLLSSEQGTRERDFVQRVTLWNQFRALFLKNLTLQTRAIGTNLCQLFTPIILLSFAGIMQLILNHIISKHPLAIPGSDTFPMPVDVGRLIACETPLNGTDGPQSCRDESFNFFLELNWEWIVKFANASNNSQFVEVAEQLFLFNETSVIPRQQLLFDLPFYYIGKSNKSDFDLGCLDFYGNRSGFVGNMVPAEWQFPFSTNFTIDPNFPLERNFSGGYDNSEGPHLSVPFFLSMTDHKTMNEMLVEVVKDYILLAHSSVSSIDQYDRNYYVTPLSHKQYQTVLERVQDGARFKNESDQFFRQVRPHGGIFIDEFENDSVSANFSYTMVADNLTLYSFNSTTPIELHRRNNIINMMSNAIFKFLTGLADSDAVAIATYIMPIPGGEQALTFDVSVILGGILYPFALSFLIPVFTSALVKDKFEKQLIMMEQNGLSRWTYWLVTYIFNYCLYIIIAVVVTVVSLSYQIRIFTQTNSLVLILVLFLWGHAEVVLGFFLSNFFSRPRTATIICYLLVIAGVVIALLLEALKVFPADRTPIFVFMLYPPFAFYRILFYLDGDCIAMQCASMEVLSLVPRPSLISVSMLYLGGSTIALIFLSIYLSYVLPTEYGVRKSPFYPIIAVYKGIRYYVYRAAAPVSRHKELSPPPSEVSVPAEDGEEEDEDVRAEEKRVREGLPPDTPVVIDQLRKEYPGSRGAPAHIAVHSISLAIQRGECFGLLGPNGAGKTTLISVLTGLYEPTRGTARIAGFDISTDIHEVHRYLGVCPQFDIQDPDLTSEEHLLFYARLKGVRWRREKEVVTRALRQVNLYEARKRKSKALSGGMRRRLSVAMACIGSPDILILDEPTTGLDPASRRQVWAVLEAVQQNRSVILTTHAMEEADHLCTRIGIMNYGKLRCLGTQTRLKARFGSGYQLQFHCAPGRVEQVESFVQSHLPRAIHMETYADSCTYRLEREDLVVSELFQVFDSVKDQVGILDWGIKMTTLEDVFLNIVKRNRDDRTPPPGSCCYGLCSCLSSKGKAHLDG